MSNLNQKYIIDIKNHVEEYCQKKCTYYLFLKLVKQDIKKYLNLSQILENYLQILQVFLMNSIQDLYIALIFLLILKIISLQVFQNFIDYLLILASLDGMVRIYDLLNLKCFTFFDFGNNYVLKV